MTKPKRRRSPPKTRSTTKPKARQGGPAPLRRFFAALAAAAVVSFGALSTALHPQWWDDGVRAIAPLLAELGLPSWDREAPVVVAQGPLATTSFADCRQLFPVGHAPVVPAGPQLRELCFSAFAVLHSGHTKTPVFVAQRLNRQMLQKAQDVQRTDRFYSEQRLPQAERAQLDDYRRSGYSRGHMAPAGDMHTADAMAQSFSLANMVPQDQIQNAGAWNQIEQDTRKYVMRAAGDVYVFTGPVFSGSSGTIGAGRVGVPTHLYKVVYDAVTGRSWVHWQENNASARAGRPMRYEEFVARTGLRLLPDAAL